MVLKSNTFVRAVDLVIFSLRLQGVFVSKVAEGGTAERDGRLHVGDKVLSVRSLWGRLGFTLFGSQKLLAGRKTCIIP